MLVEALGQWKGISVVSDEKLYPALKRAGIVSGTVADATKVRRVAEETGGWTAVTGEVLSTGGRLRITARAWDVPTSRELVRASSEIASGGDVRKAYDLVSLKLLQTAGFDSANTDLSAAATTNIDAYRAYLNGMARTRRGEVKPAVTDFQNAVRLDSNFALAWARLAEATLSSDPSSLVNPQSAAAQALARAVSLSSKLSPRDRDLVLSYDASFRAQFEDSRRLLEGLVAADSNDVEALAALAGLEMFDPILVSVPGGQRPRGVPHRAALLAKRAVQLDPSRHALLGLLASIYASAGVPGSQPAFAVDRAPTSYPDLLQLVQQRERLRVYVQLMGDSLFLVPAESLSAIPPDSVKAMRKAARAAARGWGERWVATAPNESAPHAVMSELYALDGEYIKALAALSRAESLGVQMAWSPPARRLLYSAKAGDIRAASRLADSLTATGFFANANNMMTNQDAAQWAFALHLLASRLPRAGALLDQRIALLRLMTPGAPGADVTAFSTMIGNPDPEAEPGIPRSLRGAQLDSLLAHLPDVAASPQLGPFVPLLLPILAETADTTHRRLAELIGAADRLAALGRTSLAFQVASNAASSDSTLEAAAAKFPWYRTEAEAYNMVKRTTMARFRPGSVTVSADRAVFEWVVLDTTPFTWNRAETPVGRGEYRWVVSLDAGNRNYRLTVSATARAPVAAVSIGPLVDVLRPARRSVTTGVLVGGVRTDTTEMQGVTFRAEAAAGAMRMVVTDRALLADLLRTKPAEAHFTFFPCIRPVGSTGKLECAEGAVKVTYP